MDKKGITLIEMLIVIAIIGIIAAVSIPAYVGQQTRAARTEAYANLQNLRMLEEQYLAENGVYAPTTGTAGADQSGNVALIQATTVLPGFRPGSDLSFSYQIVRDFRIDTPIASPPTWTTAQTPCFTSIASGNTGTRVAGDVFVIDCNNEKNF